MMTRPSIEALRALMTFADAGGVQKAAVQLKRPQSAVSVQLRQFKTPDACGAVLLRTKKGYSVKELQLTDAGQAVLPAIRQLVRQYDQLFEYLGGRGNAPQTIRIASGASAAQYFLPAVLSSLNKTLADIQIEVSVTRGTQRILGTVDGQFDLAIVSHSPRQVRDLVVEHRRASRELAMEKLYTQRLCVVAGKSTQAGRQLAEFPEDRVLPVKSLTQWKLVGLDRSSGVRRQLEDRIQSSTALYFVIEGGGWPAVKEFAVQGIGVGILPRHTLSTADSKKLVVRRLADDFAISHYVLHRKDDKSAELASVKKVLLESARE